MKPHAVLDRCRYRIAPPAMSETEARAGAQALGDAWRRYPAGDRAAVFAAVELPGPRPLDLPGRRRRHDRASKAARREDNVEVAVVLRCVRDLPDDEHPAAAADAMRERAERLLVTLDDVRGQGD